MSEPVSAIIETRPRFSWFWLIPTLALIAVGSLLFSAWQQSGLNIHISFQQGHGLKAGDPLRYRGMDVGRVTQIRLQADLQTLDVVVNVDKQAAQLAKEDSRFWIVRPQFSLTGAQGIETAVGANYLQVLPGSGEPAKQFTGLETPPLMALEQGGLEIILTTPGRSALTAGAPVYYRQIAIGSILDVDLSADASEVEAQVYIQPQYRNLIRTHTKFWKTGGAKFSLGWSGLNWEMDSVQTLIAGGVTLSLPSRTGDSVQNGQRFVLYDEPEDEWLSWKAHIDLHQQTGSSAQPRPQVAQLLIEWKADSLLDKVPWSQHQQYAWVVITERGLLGLASRLKPLQEKTLTQVSLNGQPLPLPLSLQNYGSALSFIAYQAPTSTAWKLSQQLAASVPENCRLVRNSAEEHFLPAGYLKLQEQAWSIASSMDLGEDWQGAAVIASKDNRLLGFVDLQTQPAQIVLLPDGG